MFLEVKTFINRLFLKKFNTIFMENIKNCRKNQLSFFFIKVSKNIF